MLAKHLMEQIHNNLIEFRRNTSWRSTKIVKKKTRYIKDCYSIFKSTIYV
jgi:hypothetical protein